MAAKTIKNFLVGLGLDIDDKSFDQADTGLDMIGKKALQMGAAVAGAFGAKALTFDFAEAKDQLGKFAEVYGVAADDVFALGGALEQSGGSLAGAMANIRELEELRAGLLTGDADFIARIGIAGIDEGLILDAENAFEAYKNLADVFKTMNEQERLNAAKALGFDDSDISLLSRGSEEMEKLLDYQRRMQPITQNMVEQAAEFNDNIQEVFRNIGGFADIISVEALQEFNKTLDSLNEFIDKNREDIRMIFGFAGETSGKIIEQQRNRFGFVGDLLSGDFDEAFTSENIESLNPHGIFIDSFKRMLPESFFSGEGAKPDANRNSFIPGGIQKSDIKIQNHLKIELDGRAFDARVREVNGLDARQTIEDTKSSAD